MVSSFNLHSALLTFSGTRAFVLALGAVELIAEGKRDLTMEGLQIMHHSDSAIEVYILLGCKEVGCHQLYGKIVFQETFVQRSIPIHPRLVHIDVLLMSLAYPNAIQP